MDDLIEIARRKERLIARCAAQRVAIAGALHDLQKPIGIAERALAAGRFVRAHPLLIAALVAGVVVFRRRHNMVGLLARGVALWRTVRLAADWARRMGLELPGRRRPGRI